jgi:formylmethanofuran dehydrogenase subunit E
VIPSPRSSPSSPLARLTATASLALALATGCAAPRPPATPAPPTHAGGHSAHPGHRPAGHVDAAPDTVDARLAEVARAHGGAGPWAVAGYRMGAFALRSLGLERGSFDLEVVHYTPHEVQYACIADGASASTGASVGKLNLSLSEATAPETRTVYRRRAAGGATITLRITKAFAARFLEVPRERLGAAGREAMELPDSDVFEIVP